MNFAISNSTAIENIALDDNTATVTFTGGRAYDYTLNDVTSFVTSLSKVIEAGESVGRFVNNEIKADRLMRIAAWWDCGGIRYTQCPHLFRYSL